MMVTIDESIYHWMNSLAPYLNLWVACFFVLTLSKILVQIFMPSKYFSYGSILSELPGLPLTLLHTVCFVKAMISLDIISMILFVWWGPGFILTAILVMYIKIRKIDFDWKPFGLVTSVACKINYLLFVLIYAYYGCYEILLAFSVWIIHDQINLAWFCENADRTRRLFEDFWLIRLAYIVFLFVPFVFDMPFRLESASLGVLLFIMWCLAIIKVVKAENFHHRPSHKDFLRNIIYLSSKYVDKP
tara:strand:- start:10241 stop:10975 length:735 start_codon:yes stop_codon:yes gene_type:complete